MMEDDDLFLTQSKYADNYSKRENVSKTFSPNKRDHRVETNLRDSTSIEYDSVSTPLAKTTTPSVSSEQLADKPAMENCETFYGLPLLARDLLEKERGIKQLYEWQHKCLKLEAVARRQNLIYCLPTSGGKTLVAEILLWREVVLMGHDAILILPYVAIVQEKIRTMEEFALTLNFFLEEYAGRKGVFPPVHHRNKRTLYVATIEKANLLINHFIETKSMDRLGLVVVDELHMIGDGHRGGILEMILTKLRMTAEKTMIVGMSATIGNIEDLQHFLKAEVYCGDFRPVELKEYVKVNRHIFEIKMNAKTENDRFVFKRKFPISDYYPNAETRKIDPDCVAGLVLEVFPSASCLVFCSSKTNCENVAKMICRVASRSERGQALCENKRTEKMVLLADLQRDGGNRVCPTLKTVIPFGVAYHHAGLTADERTLIENAFNEGTLACLTCTSTLAAGVNLPAKRVIVREPRVGNAFITCSRLKQMSGRAGRAGLNECGESVIIVKENEIQFLKQILSAGSEPCLSNMMEDSGKGLKMMLLNALSLGVVKTRSDLMHLISKTLLAIQQQFLLKDLDISLRTLVDEAVEDLIKMEFIKCSDETLTINDFGKATCKGGFELAWAKRLKDDLKLNLQSLVLHNTWLHLLYLVTPYDQVESLGYLFNPTTFRQQYFRLESDEIQVARVIGITEGIAINIGSGRSTKLSSFIIYRFYLAMILNHMWKLDPIWDVSLTFNVPRGSLQNMLQNSCHFAQNILQFCQEYSSLVALCDILPGFIQRLYFCVEPELLGLVELPAVKRSRASQLYRAGFKDIQSIANAKPEELVKAVHHLPLKTATTIINAAKNQIRKRFEELQEEIDNMKKDVQCVV